TLPGILLTGTVIVTLMYVALNFAFLYAAPMDSMAGEVEVGYIAAEAAFGTVGGRFTGIVLAMLLISTVSAMVMAGPRVIQMIGEDFPRLVNTPVPTILATTTAVTVVKRNLSAAMKGSVS
ncbi:amino acid permease, partial [Gammaproteobacteria bacterium]|nr:amino acid permease [Gammaproteobacteria bacterium]